MGTCSPTFGGIPRRPHSLRQTFAERQHLGRGTQSNLQGDLSLSQTFGMVLPKFWIGLAWVVAFYGCVAQTQALLSEDELIRALMAAREAEDSGYVRGAIPVVEKRRQQAFSAWAGKRGGRSQAFSSWAGKRSGEMPIYHEVPEYASSGHMRRKRSSGESFEDSEETQFEKRSTAGSNRFARDIREPAVGRPVKVFRPQR